MKSLRLVAGLTAIGFVLAVACGGDSDKTPVEADGGDDGKGGTGGSGGRNTGGSKVTPIGGSEATEGGTPGVMGGAGGASPGCGNGPSCDDATEECVSGKCLLNDGEACTANTQCVHTCISEACAPRADVLEDCDYSGGGAGGAGGSGGEGGVGGAQEAPTEESGNGDDLDCLDGLGCDSGSCKRKLKTDCTSDNQCLSDLCHKSKCTPPAIYRGNCEAAPCGVPSDMAVCAPTATATSTCSFNYIPASACTLGFKGATCDPSCNCVLAP